MAIEGENQKNSNDLFFSLTVSQAEILIKSWIHQVLEQEKVKPENDGLITRQQVCELLHCSYPTVLSFESKGLLSGKRMGHKIFYDREAVLQSLHSIKVRKTNIEALPGTPTRKVGP
jgi:hypothetical protein